MPFSLLLLPIGGALKKGFNEKEGPFVKRLDSALQEIGVQCQQYFGGAFIGNHVHKALKV